MRWQLIQPEHVDKGGLVNLKAAFDENWAVALAKTRIYSKKARKAALWLGSDDGCKVYLNGKCVLERRGRCGTVVDQDRAVLDLKKGWNSLVVKVEQYTGGWGLIARLEDLPAAKPAVKGKSAVARKPAAPRKVQDLEARA